MDFRGRVALKQLHLFNLVLGAMALKFLLQFASAFPVVAALATEQRNFIISYLHLVLLGFITLFVIAMIWPAIRLSYRKRVGFYCFLSAFIITELLLVFQASLAYFNVPLPYFFELMFGISGGMVIGVLLITIKSKNFGVSFSGSIAKKAKNAKESIRKLFM